MSSHRVKRFQTTVGIRSFFFSQVQLVTGELLNLVTLPNVDVCNCVNAIRVHQQDSQESVETDSAGASGKRNNELDPPDELHLKRNDGAQHQQQLLIVFSCKERI